MIKPPREFGGDKLPADQDGQNDAEFENQIGGGELERHRRDEIGSFAEHRPCQRHSRVGTGRRRGPETGRNQDRVRRGIGQQPAHLGLGHDSLNNARQEETKDQRPQDFPPHRESHRERSKERVRD
jgi:hypothetical protein